MVNSASGWVDRNVGDVLDVHSYPGPGMHELQEDRAVVLGEYGGLGLPLAGHTWQQEENWSYRNYGSRDELTESYALLTSNLLPLIKRGLSAAVYTQTSDVETEVNGLMTYDRAEIKMDTAKVRRIHAGYVPPIFNSDTNLFLDKALVEINNTSHAGEIRYTLDGSEPTEQSDIYESPVTFDETTTVNARIFWPDGSASSTIGYTCIKTALREAPPGVSGLEPGLQVEFYEGENQRSEELPDFSRLTPRRIGIAQGLFHNSEQEQSELFALKFEGYITLQKNGIYTFSSNSDFDKVSLYIDGEVVFMDMEGFGEVEVPGKIALSAGTYPIKMTFYEGRGARRFRVRYAEPGGEEQVIPSGILSHKPWY